MVTIIINNNRCSLKGNIKVLNRIYKQFGYRHPNAFFLRKGGYVQKNWDGLIHYVTENFTFKSGLLPIIIKYIESLGEKYQIQDERPDFEIIPKIPKKIGNLEFRPYQYDAISSIINNKVGDIYFWNGVINAATNAGKTIIMAGIYLSFYRKIPALVLIKDGDLFNQFQREIPELIGKDDFGMIRGKTIQWGNFTIAMVQTLSPKVSQYKRQLHQVGMVLVDEADEGESKSFKRILQACPNANIKVGLSGSIYMSQLKKDLVKNMNLRSYFSDEVFNVSKLEMVGKGHSTPVVIRIFPGNNKPGIRGDWQREYQKNISQNKQRAKVCRDRLIHNVVKHKRFPALIVCKMHEHINLMEKVLKETVELETFRIEVVHGDTPKKTRDYLLEEFRVGKIDILIASYIIKRGKNHPLIKYILNAAGSDSQSTISQIMGRGERKHESKKKYYLEDFMDEGLYLKRHSKHRINYYKKEGFKLIKKY